MGRYLSIATLLVMMAATANAAVSTYFAEVLPTPSTAPTGYRVYDMMADVGSDWTNARLDLTLTSGTLYQDSYGSDVHPNSDFYGMVPTLEWDTFVTVPGGYPAAVGVADGGMTDTSIAMSWFDSVVGTAGVYKIARITLSTDAQGTIAGKVYDVDTAGQGVPFSFTIPEGAIPLYPIAHSPDYYEINVGEALTLDASASLFTVTYEWDLDDDGLFETNAGEAGIYEVGYEYLESLGLGPAAEPYPIHLKVTDVVSGFSDTADSALMIVPEPASALMLLVGFACVRRRRIGR